MFGTLTVEENLVLSINRIRGRKGVRAGLDEAYELFPRLAERGDQMAGTLSGGEQRMLAMARVLVDAPKLLIADELSLGLAPTIVDRTYESLAAPARGGHGIARHRTARVARPRPVRPGRRDGTRQRRVVRPAADATERVQAFLYAGADGRPAPIPATPHRRRSTFASAIPRTGPRKSRRKRGPDARSPFRSA